MSDVFIVDFILFSNQQKYYHILLHRINILQECHKISNKWW